MNPSARLRQRVRRLEQRRDRLVRQLLYPREMIPGSVYEYYKRCGNPRCRCTRGDRHGPFTCISSVDKGRRRLVFVRRKDETWVRERAANHSEYRRLLSELRRMNEELLGLLKALRDTKLRTYPPSLE